MRRRLRSMAGRWFPGTTGLDRVPDPSTLEKITLRCGQGAVNQLNDVLAKKAHEKRLVKLDKVRAGTTVVPANVA